MGDPLICQGRYFPFVSVIVDSITHFLIHIAGVYFSLSLMMAVSMMHKIIESYGSFERISFARKYW
jgi:hypothetical protein